MSRDAQRRPRLTALFSAPFLGGSELFNIEFLRRAVERGAYIRAIVPGDGSLAARLTGIAHEVDVLPTPLPLAQLSRFDRRLGRTTPRAARAAAGYARSLGAMLRRDGCLVCCLGFRAQLAAALTAPAGPVCWVVHEVVPPGPFASLWRLAAHRADHILTYSHAAARQPALGGRAAVLDVRFDLSAFAAVPPTRALRTVGLIGDLFPLKNHLAVIDIVQEMRAANQNIQGLLVGRDTSDTNPTREYVAIVRERVTASAGAVEHVETDPRGIPAALSRMDVLLQLSTVPESFGRVVVEAMAAARPVIGFAHGGVTELVVRGRTGALVTPGDRAAVREELGNLLVHPERLQAWSVYAREHALARWGLDAPGRTVGDALYELAAVG